MEDDDSMPNSDTESKPQVFRPEKKGKKWTFSRRDFLKLAAAVAAGTVATFLPGVKDVLGRRVQLIAQATELTPQGLLPGQTLTKVWYLKNNATQPWGEGAMLHLTGATEWQAASSISLPNLEPGQVTPVRVSMVAPVDLDTRPIEANIEMGDEEFKVFLPIIHESSEPQPCTCDSYSPCTCHDVGPCPCDSYSPCTCHTHYCPCDYEVPCVCDTYYCACDYEVPCICDYEVPPCYVYQCPCDAVCSCVGYVPCSCDYDCGCVGYVPCGCVGYFPCGCDFFFPA